ncbi:hypothetical protein VC218_07640 [Xanthomonas nasturtii]|uniref:hypothetical protein n=1 Tax=Xanthomonas nasturtii TaxID=1843581 RepID=UPI002B2305AE|nr:hypothetical protein [Xanthomonas nasturtii]MEA9578792.1 hypothetical protein [Xanthomonas nasturtii]
MNEPVNPVEKRLGSSKHGQADARAWVEEGDGLAATARSIRARWLLIKRKIKAGKIERLRHGQMVALTGNPRASVLLMGYAVEMYLKAGLAQWLTHCPEALFLTDIRQYSHDYKRLADDLGIDAQIAPRDLLQFLSKAVTLEARYPASPREGETPIDATNRRTSDLWSDARFKAICLLVKKLRIHVVQMNSDRRNPRYSTGFGLESGGYIVMRVGGHLPSRVTVRPPGGKAWTNKKINAVLEAIPSIAVQQRWRQCSIYLHHAEKGSQRVKFKP